MPGRLFFTFSGIHSFLIGLFPFYLPVYLYTIGLSLREICFFIAATGTGYCLTLYVWDRVRRIFPFRLLFQWSFVSEVVLLAFFFLDPGMVSLLAAGLVNGIFNCSFWTIQRLLFVELASSHNSGRNFGNFQIFVLVVLKAAILVGGVLLEKWGLFSVFLLSLAMAAAGGVAARLMDGETEKRIRSAKPVCFHRISGFGDSSGSQSMFLIDGVFLYLESYFWLLSMFFIVRQNFFRLGVVVVVLALLFGVFFVLFKNTIDRLPGQKVYVAAVVLYSLSWFLRGTLTQDFSHLTTLWLLLVIALCTSLFRLSLNKRFFDNARLAGAHEYILVKSYISQFSLALIFVVLAGVFSLAAQEVVDQLSLCYYLAAVASPLYLFYRMKVPHRLDASTSTAAAGLMKNR